MKEVIKIKETIHNYDYLKEKDIVEIAVRMKVIMINNRSIIHRIDFFK